MSERALAGPAARRLADFLGGPAAALELLTVLRLRRAPLLAEGVFGQCQAWFPAVGLGLGLGLWELAEALDQYLGGAVLGWLLTGALLLLTGGLHVDGLADTADGVLGGRTREESLAIMRDSRVGPLGAAAVVLVLGLKASAFGSVAAQRPEVLVLTPALARWAVVVAIAAFPYARPQGLGKAFHATALPWPAPLATATALAAALALLGPAGLLLAVATGACALALGLGLSRRLGGLTGDTYGAINELVEVAVLLLTLVLVSEGLLT